MAIFAKKLKNHFETGTYVEKSAALLETHLNMGKLVTKEVSRISFATEAINDTELNAFNSAHDQLNTAIETIGAQVFKGDGITLTQAQIDAAKAAGLMSGDLQSYFSAKTDVPMISSESIKVVTKDFGGDTLEKRVYSMEAYDDHENRNASIYSIIYNMQASRQDEFGETFFPTIVVTPDNVGFDIVARLMMVMNDVQRDISGALTNFGKTNIIRAIANPYIIQNSLTQIIPVYRSQSAASFVAGTVVASSNFLLDGESIPTAPLATGVKVDLLGISQTDTLLANGTMDVTDAIDPDITLTNIYVTVTGGGNTDVYKFAVDNIPTSNFTYSTQNNYRIQQLNFDTTAVVFSPATLQANGSAPVVMDAIVTNNYSVKLAVTCNGSVNIEMGDTVVYGSNVAIYAIHDSNGNSIDLTTGTGLAIVNAFATAKIVGYDLRAYRTNMNRRQRGQLVDVTYYTQRYNVPLRSPITAIRPVNSVDQSDAPYVQTLITATRIRLSNQAVTQLVNTQQFLSNYVDVISNGRNDPQGEIDTELLGIGRFYVRPVYHQETVDLNDVVDSLTASERAEDIQGALVNKIRDVVYRMYRASEYQAAADALAGGQAPTPTAIIGTDPVLARYLMVTGDLRTLGGEFNQRVVSTLDERVQNKIFITFGIFDQNRNSVPNPLNFGNLAWSPELTMTVQVTRNGAISKETVVQPRFRFITNLPILGVLTIENLPNVLNKMPVEFANVAAPAAPAAQVNTNFF